MMISSNVIEVIRPISSLLFYFIFLWRNSTHKKKSKKHTNIIHLDISTCLKSIKSKQASSTQIFLYA